MPADTVTPRAVSRGAGRGLTVLSGPSGVGKGSVVAEVRRRHPEVWVSVSVTTRPPRAGEVEGKDYRFVDRATFDALVAAGDLLEHAEYAGNGYGTPRGPLAERVARGVPCLLEIEVEGARQVRQRDPRALLVFLAPPSWEELVRRLQGRGTEDAAVVARRLARAQEELAAEPEFDVTLVNEQITACADRLVALAARSG